MAESRQKSLTLLMLESVQLDHPLSVVQEVASRLEPGITGVLDAISHTVQMRLGEESVDAMLMICARAAKLTASEETRAWASIRRGFLAAARGSSDRAHSLIADGFKLLDGLDVGEDEALQQAYGNAGHWLADFYLSAGQVDEVREIFSTMLRNFHTQGDDGRKLRTLANLVSVSLSVGDVRSAASHGQAIIERPWRELLAGDEAALDAVWGVLQGLALQLYGLGVEGYATARTIAAATYDAKHPDGPLLLVLAMTAFSAKDYEESLTYFDQLLVEPQKLLPSYEVRRLHHRKAYCLVYLDRENEAFEEIAKATQVDPGNPYLHYAASQIHRVAGDLQGEIEELTETHRFATQRMESSKPSEEPETAPHSETEYLESLPVEDLRDFALIRRAQALREAGDVAAGEADLRHLETVADDVTRGMALALLAEWREEEGRFSEAADLLRRAIPSEGGPREKELLLQLATVEIRNNEYDQALVNLQRLGHKSMEPEKAVELLERFPAEHEVYTRALKLRGYAKTEAGWPQEGLADLDAAIEAESDDAEAYYLRALTKITLGIKPESEDWNSALDMRNVRDALEDLYVALRLDPYYRDARRVLQWLVERAADNPQMYDFFSAGGTPSGDLFRVFPELEEPLALSWEASAHGYKRDFVQAVKCYQVAMQKFRRAGFEIMATRLHLRLADVYIRLVDMDRVAKHLKAYESLDFLINQPLSEEVIEQYQQHAARRGEFQKPAKYLELEYAWIYKQLYWGWLLQTCVRANFRHRVGDLNGALEDAELLSPLLEHSENIGTVLGTEEILWIIAIYRSAERYDEALRLLDRLESSVKDADSAFDVLYSRALIVESQGDSEGALEYHERALEGLRERERPVGVGPRLQYAATLLQAGRAIEAKNVLEEIDNTSDVQTDREALIFESVNARVCRDLEEYDEALIAVERAVAIAEEGRASIVDPVGRRSWQGGQSHLFSVGVEVCVKLDRPTRAWELCELSKSRTLLDELAGRESVSDEHARIVDALDSIEKSIGIADDILEVQDDSNVSQNLVVEAAAMLATLLTPTFDRIRESKEFADGDFKSVREMLEERRDVLEKKELDIRESASVSSSDVVDLTMVKALLVA